MTMNSIHFQQRIHKVHHALLRIELENENGVNSKAVVSKKTMVAQTVTRLELKPCKLLAILNKEKKHFSFFLLCFYSSPKTFRRKNSDKKV